jgi:hypothetical protein
MSRLTHKLQILHTLHSTSLKLTATDFSYVSNANQYFVELEHQGLITSEWGIRGKAKVKLRFIADEQMKKVEQHLNTYGIKADDRVNSIETVPHSIGANQNVKRLH